MLTLNYRPLSTQNLCDMVWCGDNHRPPPQNPGFKYRSILFEPPGLKGHRIHVEKEDKWQITHKRDLPNHRWGSPADGATPEYIRVIAIKRKP